jgi:hypothetical protein
VTFDVVPVILAIRANAFNLVGAVWGVLNAIAVGEFGGDGGGPRAVECGIQSLPLLQPLQL